MTSPTYPNRAATLRQRLLSKRAVAPTKHTIDGVDFFLREPVLADKDKLARLALGAAEFTKKNLENIAIDRMMAAAVIILACDEAGEPVFEATDFEAIRTAPVGGEIDKLAQKALNAINGKDPAEGEAPGGPSEPDSGTSSPTA